MHRKPGWRTSATCSLRSPPTDIQQEIARLEGERDEAIKEIESKLRFLKRALRDKKSVAANGQSRLSREESEKRVAEARAYLTEHGPTANDDLAQALGFRPQAIRMMLQRRGNEFKKNADGAWQHVAAGSKTRSGK